MGKFDALKPLIDDAVRGILDLLGSGRADEITDSMLDLGDPVLNARLNEALWQKYDLPMDAASRMERATAMGHKGGLYSGTGDDFTGFNNKAWATTNPDLAYTYAPSDGGTVMPLTMRARRGAPVVEAGGANWNALTPSMRAGGPDAPYLPNILRDPDEIAKYGEDILTTNNFAKAAKDQGFSGVTFNDVVDVGGYLSKHFPQGPAREAQLASIRRAAKPSTVEMRLYPNQVRSAFARFDPRLAHLKNLNAALAGAAGVGGGLLAMTPEEATAADFEQQATPTISSQEPTTVEWLAGKMTPAMQSFRGMFPGVATDERAAYQDAQKLASLLDFIPFVGSGISADQARRDVGQGDYGNAVLNSGFALLDIVPGLGKTAKAVKGLR